MQAVGLPVRGIRARRWLDRLAVVGVGLSILAVGSVAVAFGFGHRPLLVRSGSMEPAIHTGDVVLSKLVRPGEVAVGDVVTFRDPTRDQLLITHRVVSVERQGAVVAFVTRGDANTGVEEWSVGEDGTVGRVSLRIPRAGYVLAWLGLPIVRMSVLVLGCALLGWALLRRIWIDEG